MGVPPMFHGQDAHALFFPNRLTLRHAHSYLHWLRYFESPSQGLAKTVDIAIEQLVIEKAKSLIEALGYIQRFNERIVVVKLGGSFMDSEDEFKKVLTDVVFMQ